MKRFFYFAGLFSVLGLLLAMYVSTPVATGAVEESPRTDVAAAPEYSENAPTAPSQPTVQPEPVTGTFPIPTSTPSPQSIPKKPNSDIVLGTIARPVLRLPNPPIRPIVRDARIATLKNRIARFPAFTDYRRLAELYVQLGLFAEAAQTYRTEAALFRRKGLADAAIIEDNKAARYETQLQLFEQRAPTSNETKALFSQARLEPKVGRYVGAFIDRDERLHEIIRGNNFQAHRRPREFASLIGKNHSTYFTYVAYGQNVPMAWLEMCKRDGVIPHIAWEPKNLNQVQDDKYLKGWAKTLRDYDWPVFIRFAGEMNGFWTPYHGNPKLYREKFRLVHRVLRQAPRVATIWCVNSIPSETIASYYPGDDGCDWVGINLYSVPFYDNNRKRPALLDNPLTLLESVYRRYAARKPIAICEYGASHQAALDKVLRTGFATEKLSILYGALPRFYPRIKMISWLDQNNLKHARAGRQLNNYSLTEHSVIARSYRSAVREADYLEQIPDEFLPKNKRKPRPSNDEEKADSLAGISQEKPEMYFALRDGQKLASRARLSIWVKSYVSRPRVFLAVNGVLVYAAQGAGAHSFVLQNSTQPEYSGAAKTSRRNVVLTAYVYDDRNRFVQSQRVSVAFRSTLE